MDIMHSSDMGFLLVELKEGSSITVGVPHHTPGGQPFMPTPSRRPGDENAGFLGRNLARELQASFICAGNYFIDPNKSLKTDYSQAIIRSSPEILIEIHGHGHYNTDNDVEISCGFKKREKKAIRLVEKIQEEIMEEETFPEINRLKLEGRFDHIYFQARSAATIRTEEWLAYHIEIPLFLRVADDLKSVPPEGSVFSRLLGRAFKRIISPG